MALDGMMLNLICGEIRGALSGAKTDRICQPDRDVLVFTFRTRDGMKRLLLSASADSARVCLTESQPENPASPPMFCMLLRKHLSGSRLLSAGTVGLERVAVLEFECFNDFGDRVNRKIAVEVMGKHSNIILVDERGIIIDAIKRIDFTSSSARQVLPGLRYEYPPMQDKLNPLSVGADVLADAILNMNDIAPDKAVLRTVQGFSPVVCREIVHRVFPSGNVPARFSAGDRGRLEAVLAGLMGETRVPCLLLDKSSGRPAEFSFTEIHQYGSSLDARVLPSFSLLAETAFEQRAKADAQKRKQNDLLKVLTSARERISRKLAAQRSDLQACADKEKYRRYGDIISGNIWRMKKGADFCELEDFYDGGSVRIPLDPTLTPSQNAQRYYKKYRKADNAQKALTQQVSECEAELSYIDTVFDELSRAETLSEISEIRDELIRGGYVRPVRGSKQPSHKPSRPDAFVTDDGLTVLCGRNNVQNDQLTLKTASKSYLWLHAKNIPGCHAVIMADADSVPERSLLQAAVLAATFCKAAASGRVPVDYTLVKHVKKPSGAKPGMVIYTDQRTLFVAPDEKLADRLRK